MEIKTKIVSCHRADYKPVKQEVKGTVILPPFSIPCLDTKNGGVFKAQARDKNFLVGAKKAGVFVYDRFLLVGMMCARKTSIIKNVPV